MTNDPFSPALPSAPPIALPLIDCCAADEACCSPAPDRPTLTRRALLGATAAGALASWIVPEGAVAVPGDKNFDRGELSALRRRGAPTRFTGAALTKIGMPVGGAGAGQVYASGDGEPWLWDIANPDMAEYGGTDWTGIHYAEPIKKQAPFDTGVGLRVGSEAETIPLNAAGFDDVTFTGTYPIGRTTLRSATVDAEVDVAMYSPFVPGDVEASSLPATILEYTVKNPSSEKLTYELIATSANPVGLRSKLQQPMIMNSESFDTSSGAGLSFTASVAPVDTPEPGDQVLEDWSNGYAGWTVGGAAFGDEPVDVDQLPAEMLRFGPIGATGDRVVTSYNFRGDGTPDGFQGKLTSASFTIEHRTLLTRVGGGDNDVSLRVIVDDTIVAETTGLNLETLRPVFLDLSDHQGEEARVEIVDASDGPWSHITVDRLLLSDRDLPPADVSFEDWESTGFGDWVEEGDAFGGGPVTEASCPDYFKRGGPLNVSGEHFVTSHTFREYPDAGAADERVGTLTSPEFTVVRRYLAALIGGGGDRSQVGLRLLIEDQPVRVLAGRNDETLTPMIIDVSAYEGRRARLQLFDHGTAGWGHVNCDRIWFTDLPLVQLEADDLPDGGSFSLSCIAPDAETDPDAGTVSAPFALDPGASRMIRFAYAWHFPTISAASFGLVDDFADLQRHYATRFDSAVAVARHLDHEIDALSDATATFVHTWYEDSSLPHWLLERTLAPASTVATETCHRFSNGRFYAWEGTYCCVGTCTHVWNYAQSLAYLFPALERDARTRTDYGSAFHEDTGAIDYRGEWAREVAHDGQCGNILRTYREHQMSADDSFLSPIWPRVKRSMEFLIKHDGADPNGVLEAAQYNTLDATWYGEIPWITGLYVAALRAAAELATDMDDPGLAATCSDLAEQGTSYLSSELWNDTYGYFEQKLDPDHGEAINSNRGCYLDQMFGQTYAHQLDLPRVFDADKSTTALQSLFRNNFLPDAQKYQDVSGIPGGRAFSTEGEAGTLMCTWPHGGQDEAPGDGEAFAIGYFNEVWTGQEYQFAAQLLREGLVDEGLAVVRAVHDRYADGSRNPYNEVECSDHYARAMMSHAVYLAVCGFHYHGPRGQIAFDPVLSPEDFRAAFTVAEGWGSYWQRSSRSTFRAGLELRHGELRGLRSLTIHPSQASDRVRMIVVLRGSRIPAEVQVEGDGRLVINFGDAIDLASGDDLTITAHF